MFIGSPTTKPEPQENHNIRVAKCHSSGAQSGNPDKEWSCCVALSLRVSVCEALGLA